MKGFAMSKRPNIKDGVRRRYLSRYGSGIGRVIEVYPRANGWWVALHDRKRNIVVQVRPGQLSPV
jgi:hypothetical protein